MNFVIMTLRIGSKGIYQKNIRLFNGKPLCYWVIREAFKSKNHAVFILTDSEKIIDKIKEFDFYKKNNLNNIKLFLVAEMNDRCRTDTVVYNFLSRSVDGYNISDNDIMTIAQVTNPLVTTEDFNKGLLEMRGFDSVISATRDIKFIWNTHTQNPVNHSIECRPRRQELEYSNAIENGSFYIISVGRFLESKYRTSGNVGFHIMPNYTKHEIDTMDDFEICEMLHRKYIIGEKND